MMTREEAISWFENRMKNITVPGARSMYAMALAALREQEERRGNRWSAGDVYSRRRGEWRLTK